MQVWLPVSDLVRLEQAAKKTGCTKSQLAREAIQLMLDQTENRVRERLALSELGLSFEDFSRDCRFVVGRAADEAYKLGYNKIGSEHLLLGLCTDPTIGDLLFKAGIKYSVTRNKLLVLWGFGNDAILDELAFTPGCVQTLKRARKIARHSQDKVITSEHLLSALLAQGKGGAYDILEFTGADREALRQAMPKSFPEKLSKSQITKSK